MIAALLGWRGYAVVAVGCTLAGFGGGYKLRSLQADHAALRAVQAQVKVVERVVYRERAQADVTSAVETRAAAERVRVETIIRTIIKEVPKYVTPQTDTRFALPLGLIRVHDAAALGVDVSSLSYAAGQSDDAPAPAKPSELAATIADNYGVCLATGAQLIGLQSWVRAQADLDRTKP